MKINFGLKQAINNTKLTIGNLYKLKTNSFCMNMNMNEMDLINYSNKSFKTKYTSNKFK